MHKLNLIFEFSQRICYGKEQIKQQQKNLVKTQFINLIITGGFGHHCWSIWSEVDMFLKVYFFSLYVIDKQSIFAVKTINFYYDTMKI